MTLAEAMVRHLRTQIRALDTRAAEVRQQRQQLKATADALRTERETMGHGLAEARAAVTAERQREVHARLDTGMTAADMARALGYPVRAVEQIIATWEASEGVTIHRRPAIPERRSVTSPIRDEK